MAGFWLRAVACLIDGLILGVINGIGLLVLGAITASSLHQILTTSQDMTDDAAGGVVIGGMLAAFGMFSFFVAFTSWLYFAIQEASSAQSTPGKRAFGLKVCDMNGQRISFGRATGRFLAKSISSMFFGIGYIMAGFTEKKQGLHDMMAGTLVVRTR